MYSIHGYEPDPTASGGGVAVEADPLSKGPVANSALHKCFEKTLLAQGPDVFEGFNVDAFVHEFLSVFRRRESESEPVAKSELKDVQLVTHAADGLYRH